MYSFYKVKSRRNQQEFRHPFFRRDQPDDLKYIKRKNVNKRLKQMPETPVKEEPLTLSHSKVCEQIEKLQGVLDFIAEQNRTLAQTNRNIVGQLFSSKSYCEAQIRDFISMMFVTMSVPNTRLINDIRQYMGNLEFDASSLPMPSLLDRNVVNADALVANAGKVFNMQDAMDNIFGIYRGHITDESGNRSVSSITDSEASVQKPIELVPDLGQVKANRELPLLTLMPVSSDACAPYREYANVEHRARTVMLLDSPLPVIKVSKPEDKFSITLSPIKYGSMADELNNADLHNCSFYHDNDVVSVSEFPYSPVTPLFQEDF